MDVHQQDGKGQQSCGPHPTPAQATHDGLELRESNPEQLQPRQVVGPEDVVRGHVFVRPKFHRDVVQLLLERAKQLVPKHQRPPKISVQIRLVFAMVNAVVGRRDHDVLKEPRFVHQRIVVVELHEVVHGPHRHKNFRRNANNGQDNEKRNGRHGAVPAVANAQGKAEVIALMVHHVHGPQHPKLVMHAMQPVKAEVPKQQGQCELRHVRPFGHPSQTETFVNRVKHRHFKPSEHPKNRVPRVQVEHNLVPRHFFALNEPQDERFDGHHQKEQRGRKDECHRMKLRKT
tara:strand:- start:837 stop:1700 length:864 start_codon:yes stop_codon:yes gene_type:complete